MGGGHGKEKKEVVVLFTFCTFSSFLLESWPKLGGYPLRMAFHLLHRGDEDPLSSRISLEFRCRRQGGWRGVRSQALSIT